MTQVTEWLDHYHIEVVTIVGTAAILIVAAIIILVLSRLSSGGCHISKVTCT
jgi:hypothetical protein